MCAGNCTSTPGFRDWTDLVGLDVHVWFGLWTDGEGYVAFQVKEKARYCNGPLKPGTEYRFKIRAYTTIDKFSETAWSKPIRTDPDNTAVLVGIIIPIILLILAVIVIFAIKR